MTKPSKNAAAPPIYQPFYPQQMTYRPPEPEGEVKRGWKVSRIILAFVLFALLNFGLVFLGDFVLAYFTEGIMHFRAPELFFAAGGATVLMAFGASIPGNKPVRWLKNILRVLLILLSFIAVWFYGLTYYAQDAVLYMKVPYSEKDMRKVESDGAFERIEIPLASGEKIGGWFFKNVAEAGKQPLLLYFGGNAEEATGEILTFAGSRKQLIEGYNVVVIDYPGYGLSQGKSGEENVYRFAKAAYESMCQRDDVDTGRMVLGAWSLGTGTAIRLAAELQPAGLFLIAPFYSGERLIRGYGTDMLHLNMLPLFPIRNPYLSYSYAPHYEQRVLLITSRGDKMINYTQSLELGKLFPDAEMLELESGGHVGYWYFDKVQQAVKTYLATVRRG